MRFYENCFVMMSEIMRDLLEMGLEVHPASMQNKIVRGDDQYITKEMINYSYALLYREEEDYLFLTDPRSKEWCKAEFKERISGKVLNPGKAWKIRMELWKEFLVNTVSGKRFDYTYSERIIVCNALLKIIYELNNNPDSRQCILTIWQPQDIVNIGGRARVPCSIYYQFMIRNNQLIIIYNQRSADVFAHFGNDIWLAWELGKYVAHHVGVEFGYLVHNIASLHTYKKDWGSLKIALHEIKALHETNTAQSNKTEKGKRKS